jgi:hypothetical protein
MLKIKIFLFLAGSTLFLQSCATSPTTTISAVATMDQKVGYGDTIVSQKKHFVSFAPYTRLDAAVSNIGLGKNKLKFMLTVENCGRDPIEFSHKKISVIFVPDTDNTEPRSVGVQSWQDFVTEMDKEYDRNEKQYIYTTLYDLYMQSEVGLDVTEKLGDLAFDIESMRDQNDVLQEMLPAVIIKQQRILPGKSYSGVLICETGGQDAFIQGHFRISIALDGENHRFVFRRGLSG